MVDPIAPVKAAVDAAVANTTKAATATIVGDKNAARADVAKSPIKSVLIAMGVGFVLAAIAFGAFKIFVG